MANPEGCNQYKHCAASGNKGFSKRDVARHGVYTDSAGKQYLGGPPRHSAAGRRQHTQDSKRSPLHKQISKFARQLGGNDPKRRRALRDKMWAAERIAPPD